MLSLPFGCYCSPLKVNPKNWQSPRASIKKDWFVYFRFYDPLFKDNPKYKKGKLVVLKGMNGLKTLKERRLETEKIINREADRLRHGFNPITGKEVCDPIPFQEISPTTPFLQALGLAKTYVKGAPSTHRDLRSILRFVCDSANQLGLTTLPINTIKRKHLKALLLHIEQVRGPSAHRHNKIRSNLMMLFRQLTELEVVETNPVKELSKQKSVQRLRTLLTQEQRDTINSYLKEHHYRLWIFTHVFFHSGSRLTEMVLLKRNQVHLEKRYFIVTVKKGNQSKEVMKPIKEVAVPYWEEALSGAEETDYLFAKDLLPGPAPIQSFQITKRWNRHIKKKLCVAADFYSLKHLNLDETSALLGLPDAAAMASHTSTAVTEKYYTINERERQIERLKSLTNRFA